MKTLSLICMLSLLALTVTACATSTPAALEPTPGPVGTLPRTEADVPRVTVQEAKAALENGTAVIVDVRALESFNAMHIRGALSIPLTGIEVNPAGVALDKNKWIITYCT